MRAVEKGILDGWFDVTEEECSFDRGRRDTKTVWRV